MRHLSFLNLQWDAKIGLKNLQLAWIWSENAKLSKILILSSVALKVLKKCFVSTNWAFKGAMSISEAFRPPR